jgi:hypothetical protein
LESETSLPAGQRGNDVRSAPRPGRDAANRIGSIAHFRALGGGGYRGAISLAPFAASVRDSPTIEGDIAAKFKWAVLDQPRVKRLLSAEDFSVDGALIEIWAPMKSFKPKDGSHEPPAERVKTAGKRIFSAKSDRTTRSHQPPIPRPSSIRKGRGKEAKRGVKSVNIINPDRLPPIVLCSTLPERRKPPTGRVHHSDCGSQYAALVYRKALLWHGFVGAR